MIFCEKNGCREIASAVDFTAKLDAILIDNAATPTTIQMPSSAIAVASVIWGKPVKRRSKVITSAKIAPLSINARPITIDLTIGSLLAGCRVKDPIELKAAIPCPIPAPIEPSPISNPIDK